MADKTRKPKSSRYRDIAAKLQKEIRLGKYPIGNLLPTETELMAQHSASRQTVREALRILMDQGLIVRRAGLGSVIIATEPPGAVHPQRQIARRVAADIPTKPIAMSSGAARSSRTASSPHC